MTEKHRRTIDANDQETLEKAVARSLEAMTEEEQAIAAKKAMTGFERTKILRQLETSIDANRESRDENSFIALNRVRDTIIELCDPLLRKCEDVLSKQKGLGAIVDENKHSMMTL